MRALDGIEPDEESDDYEVEDIAEDDSLVGYRPCRVRVYVPVRQPVPLWWRVGVVLSMHVYENINAETLMSVDGIAQSGGSAFEHRCLRSSVIRVLVVRG